METSLIPNVREFLVKRDPFDKLPESLLDMIIRQVEISYLVQGEILPETDIVGKGLYLVRTGAVEQRHADKTLRARLGAGDVFGFSVLDKMPGQAGLY